MLAGRVSQVERGVMGSASLMSADYYYYPNGLLEQMDFGNNNHTWYEYDDANRLTSIRRLAGGAPYDVEYVYTWTDNDLPETIIEKHNTVPVATTSFSYDNRGRLIHEWRTGLYHYDMSYTYDNNGNRKTKTDATDPLNVVRVDYEYDIDDPSTYGTANNRLMSYQTRSVPEEELLSTTWYDYNGLGNVSRIVTNVDGTGEYSSTWLIYARNGETVSYVIGETWEEGQGPCQTTTNYNITFGREFRYDGTRERYLNRELDPVELLSGNIVEVPAGTYWSDYDRGDIYGDYTVDQGTATETMSFQPGLARTADPLGTPATDYYHTDHLGTTRELGYGVGMRTFTAFGEHVAGLTSRYGYAGAWGYQTHDDFAYLHVGARYYDPATGRFLQRDPIGIEGGLNVYEYVRSRPVTRVDPDGTYPFGGFPQHQPPPPTETLPPIVIEIVSELVATHIDGGIGMVIGGTIGTVGGAISGAGAGAVAGGVGAGPGAIAGGIAGGLKGAVEGYAAGCAGHWIHKWLFGDD